MCASKDNLVRCLRSNYKVGCFRTYLVPMGLQRNEDGCCDGGVWAEEKVAKGRLKGWWCVSECSGNKNGVVVGKWLRMLKKKENEILRKDKNKIVLVDILECALVGTLAKVILLMLLMKIQLGTQSLP